MYRNKKDVDKHVESLISKLSAKEFKNRAYSVARLYFEVGDYASCQRYVEQYLTQKDTNAAAHKLLGQALQKLGQKERALEQYRTSLNIDPTQTSLILDICELLTDDEVAIDIGRSKYWCEKAEATFPRHPVTFNLREKLMSLANPDPEAIINLLKGELAVRPKDTLLHCRLLKYYLETNRIKEAFEHSCNVEFGENNFPNNYAWYETLAEVLKHYSQNINDWLYQLLLLTVKERLCVLSLTETPHGTSKGLVESNELLHIFDQAIEDVAKAGAFPGFADFHASLLQHHRGQFAFHAATFSLKKAKKDQLSWRDATRISAPLMLIAWHTVPLDYKVNWLTLAPEKQQKAVYRWYLEGTYRCSQSGHYLLSNIQDKSQTFLDKISQICSGTHWRDKIYEKLFTNREHLNKIKSSHFVSNAFNAPTLRLPRKIEVEAFDIDAQREYASSLHHFVWILLNYKNYAHFKCTLFDMLTTKSQNFANCGPETLNKLDVHAFLYSAALTCRQQKFNQITFICSDKPNILPANITDLLCSLSQMKWWDCAYKFSQNKLGTELTDIRATLSRGIEVVRCIDNHGLDPELLCILGRIFSERVKLTTSVEEKNNLEKRAGLYYSSAIPLLEKLKSKLIEKLPEKRMFDYTHKEFSTKDLNSLIEESKLYVAGNYLGECEYEKAIELLSNLKSPQAFYYLSDTYKRMSLEEINCSRDKSIESKTKTATLLSKAKSYAYKALDRLKETEINANNHPLYLNIQELIEEIEMHINKIDLDLSSAIINDVEFKYSSDENVSISGNEHIPSKINSHVFRNISSTPKQLSNTNTTNYRTAVDSQLLDCTRVDQQFLERIENQIKNLQKRDTTINDFMEQTKNWFEENRKLGNQIISTIQSNIQNSTDQFKLLKISVDQVKDQIDECRNECKDVGDLKKQIAELKKEVHKLKKASSEQTIDESDLYNLDEDYRTSDGTSTFAAQLPFTPPQVIPPFNQRLVPPFPVPPNPYQLYGQSLYNLYNQYSQFAQPSSIPGAPPIFDSTRPQVNYPNIYPSPDQMYLDVAHLVPPTVPSAVPGPTIPTIPAVPAVPTIPVVSVPSSITMSKPTATIEAKENVRSLPVNVVITSSDPLPTCTTAPAPILSVTIPPKHIKGTPHNYQIPMPSSNETKVVPPPIFSFPIPGNKSVTTPSSLTNWNQSSVFKTTSLTTVTTTINASMDSSVLYPSKIGGILDNSTSVVDGNFTGSSPNTSLNKSRTLSERSNTSIENYDPCPDFKPIIPLPAEVKVTTGEEDEIVIFCARAKLFRFVDKQWKERGLGEMKLLKHKITGKVRVLMRREQVYKVCANHIITPEIEIKPMKNETKAYFWVANDFADETVVLEKFCIRFKTVDIAQQFYDTFEKARKECEECISTTYNENKLKVESSKTSSDQYSTPSKNSAAQPADFQLGKTVVGGFTFSSTPTFKPVPDNNTNDIKVTEPATSKVNVFSSLSFKTTTSSPFSNLFNSSANQTKGTIINQESPNKLNSSDTVEEFEPTVEFKPVVPLPALVDQKTGEEGETILFEHRAKLLRFDAATKEWKERGLGNIKLLVQKDNTQKLRLLMRREQVMKVCCNHAVTIDMSFQKMPNMDKAVTWCAKDFSEGELVPETFCLRFKTVQACDNFIEAVKLAQSKLKDDSKASKEEQNAAKQVGFGDNFKPKPGSWSCETCYTNNLENFNKCACCEQPKPQSNTISPIVSNWGDNFKLKPGTWECNQCFVRNEGNFIACNACNSPRDLSATKTEIKLTSENAPKYTFGIPSQTTSNIQTKIEGHVSVVPMISGWGDKFLPKEGSWECKQCFVRNESNVQECCACSNPKDPNAKFKFDGSVSGPKFNFGIPQNSNIDQKSKTETTTTSIFDGTGAHKFSFGIPITQEKSPTVLTFGSPTPLTCTVFGTPKPIANNDGPLNFSIKKKDENDKTYKPALLPTPKKEISDTCFNDEKDNINVPFPALKDTTSTPLAGVKDSSITPFAGVKNSSNISFGSIKESGTFDFVFKPKTPPKNKSLTKSPISDKGDESDGNEYASEDEGHHIHFSPVIPMPDKIDVVTGEENEDELYGHRAKLFRLVSGEWKERGIGVVKILKHKDTGKLRVVMRREQVLKICLNHSLTAEIIYKPKDERSWFFVANDFSEGELNLQQFCLRFKTKEIAIEFKDAVDKAREGKSIQIVEKSSESDKKDKESDDVVFVSEIQATKEEKQIAKKLMLPENFFTYKNREPCQGCRGCNGDDDTQTNTILDAEKNKEIKTENSQAPAITVTSIVSTPVKISSAMSTSQFQSPTNSTYGTPVNINKTVDTSIFRTPLESIGSNVKTPAPINNNNIIAKIDATNKENTLIQKPNIFGFSEQKSIFGTPQSNLVKQFGTSETQTPTNTNISITAPKPNILDPPSVEKLNLEPKLMFGSAQNKSIFGETKTMFNNANLDDKSVFGFSADKQCDLPKAEVKSVFGGDTHQKSDLFGSSQGSIFGSNKNAQIKSGTSIFGSTGMSAFGSGESDASKVFGSGKSVFENASNQTSTWIFGSKIDEKKQDVTSINKDIDKKDNDVQKDNESTKKEIPFKVDNSLTFAALSSSGSGFNIQKKQDFQWEGAGQQLFATTKKTPSNETNDKTKNDSSAGNDSKTADGAEEEYDPHYEPIVPLPDKIVVTTGEEDEEKIFGERCKLYRYDEKSREWKERGIGEMKILYHPERKTYRLLLRREQVHKAVLNMLLFMDLELLPMKNSDRAWTWAGRNFAENSAGEQETLAVRFKSTEFANSFQSKVVECIRKLQAAEAQAIREQKETNEKGFGNIAPLRLPKHLEDSARVDTAILAKIEQQIQSSQVAPSVSVEQNIHKTENKSNGELNKIPVIKEVTSQVHFKEPEEEEEHADDDEDDYEHDYENNEDYEAYYNEDEEESAAYYTCDGEAVVRQGDMQTTCTEAHVQVLYDQEIYSPKILVTNSATGEILADMLIHTDTEFQMSGDSCTWSGTDYTSNDPVDKTVTINFHDSDTAMQFYDSCETSKAATYSSTDPES